MEQLLHKITVEFQNLKNKSNIEDVLFPSIDGNTNIPGINIFIASLFAANRNLSAQYTTLKNVRKNEWSIKKNAPRVSFLNYYINSEVLFLKDDVYHYIPSFDETNNADIEALKELFTNNKIVSFGTRNKQEVENTFGETLKISFGKNILNYIKEEAIPNEYIVGLKIHNTQIPTLQDIKEKENIENKIYNNFQEAQQQLFILLYSYRMANLSVLKPFALEELSTTPAELIINSNNNAKIAKSIIYHRAKEKEVKNKSIPI